MTSQGAKDLMNYSFLVVFGNDGIIDEGELAMLERLALKDGVVDEDERAVLHNIFSRVTQDQVTEAVWKEILHFKSQYNIP